MDLRIFHQVGHNAKWNRDSFTEDGIGDGLILSPVHQKLQDIEKLDSEIKKNSCFDPQFYLPSSQKAKLKTYDFFPDVISEGFETFDFSAKADDCAEKCVLFQMQQNFDRIIIPARFYEEYSSDFCEKQAAFSVHPFLKALRNQKNKKNQKKVFLTLPLTQGMVTDRAFRENILNWITGFPEVDGIYVFVQDNRQTKQVQDEFFLSEYLTFLKAAQESDLDLMIGYQNTEALLFTLLGKCDLTIGSFENTRMFSIDKFVVSDDERRGPRARIYLPGLLNWVQFRQAKEIQEEFPDIWREIYKSTRYGDAALNSPTEPTFNQPGLYKHYFSVFSNQIEELKSLDISSRFSRLKGWIKNAQLYYKSLSDNHFDFEYHANEEHLQAWLSAINRYFRSL